MLSSGDVVELDVGMTEGREAGLRRPAVLVTAQRILDADPDIVHVVPLTSTIRPFRSEVAIPPDAQNGLVVASAAQCQHVRSVARHRILATRGSVGPLTLMQLRETIATLLDLP